MELTNSKRVLRSASWVTVKLDDHDKRRVEQAPSGALSKVALVRALGLTSDVLARATERGRDEHVDRVASSVREALGEEFPGELAARLAQIPARDLVSLARAIPVDDRPSSFDLLLDVFEERQQISPIGWLYLERVEMYPIGVERGEMVFTVPLAPGETQTISHKEWSTSSQTYENIVQDYFESYSEKGVAEKADASMSAESEVRRSNVINFGASLSGGYGPVSLTTTFGLTNTKDERESAKQSSQRTREVTEKAAARARQEHKVSVKLEQKKATEDSSFKTITNKSDDAVRIDYYRMMRKWRTDLYRYGLRLTYDITIPAPGARLWARWRRLAELEAKARESFQFTLKPGDITDKSWPDQAAKYGVALEPPLNPRLTLSANRVMEGGTWGDNLFEFAAPRGYEIVGGAHGTISYWGPPGYPTFHFSGGKVTQQSGGSGGGVYEADLEGTGSSERLTISIVRNWEYRLVIALVAQANRRLEEYSAWQMKCWIALRDASFAEYQANMLRIQGERDRLYRALVDKDTLSLRQLEREEILRLVMLWLVGPNSWYSNAPSIVEQTISRVLHNETLLMDGKLASDSPTLDGVTSSAWSSTLLFGEFVRYIHQAIEWENLLYFLYPYYWGAEATNQDKLLFEHSDPEHQKFLRAGYARIVITVRPGFEQDFVKLMETGKFNGQSTADYQSVAQDIENVARTNYTGIPPANPEMHSRPLLYPLQRKTWKDMESIILAIEAYLEANGACPNSLSDLPAGTPTKDAWGHDFVYRCPGSANEYDLISLGEDGDEGGEGTNADISSAAGASLIASWFDYTPTSGIDLEVGTPPAIIA